MARKPTIKQRVIQPKEARNYRRLDLAASVYGISVALLKKLINQGKLTRYKLGAATMIDANELEKLIVADPGNHGAQAAPQLAAR
jgi:hypothetical protein